MGNEEENQVEELEPVQPEEADPAIEAIEKGIRYEAVSMKSDRMLITGHKKIVTEQTEKIKELQDRIEKSEKTITGLETMLVEYKKPRL